LNSPKRKPFQLKIIQKSVRLYSFLIKNSAAIVCSFHFLGTPSFRGFSCGGQWSGGYKEMPSIFADQ
jgi:hypothetical protein